MNPQTLTPHADRHEKATRSLICSPLALNLILRHCQEKTPNSMNRSVNVRQEGRKSSPPCYVRPLNPGNSTRSVSLHLREITASRCWKIVFSFSAEFLKSSGHNDVRKKAAYFCHMFRRADERRLSCVLSGGRWVENY